MTIAERHNKVASGGNQRPQDLVDVVEAVTAVAVGRRRGDSGPVCAEVISMHSRAHPARAPRLCGGSHPLEGDPRRPSPHRNALALPRLPRLAQKLIFPSAKRDG
jgi:hypothetical protein